MLGTSDNVLSLIPQELPAPPLDPARAAYFELLHLELRAMQEKRPFYLH